MLHTSQLVYSLPGKGKTAYIVSALWDWQNRVEKAKGKLISFGREYNPALLVPQHFQEVELKNGKKVSLRFKPDLDDKEWLDDLYMVLDGALAKAKRGELDWEVLAIDGFSELSLLIQHILENNNTEKFSMWGTMLTKCFGLIQRLDPEALNCHVLCTAKVEQTKKPMVNESTGKILSRGDPDIYTFDYYPLMRGSFRHWFPYYFDSVFYLDTALENVEGSRGKEVVHRLFTQEISKDYLVKNIWKHHYNEAGIPAVLTNASFYDIHNRLEAHLNGSTSAGGGAGEITGQSPE